MSEPFSDYGSGNTTGSGSEQQRRLRTGSLPGRPRSELLDSQSADYLHLLNKYRLEEVRREFQMNGSDSPYNPDDDVWTPTPGPLAGLGRSAQLLRQRSWPAAEAPRPRSLHAAPFHTSTPLLEDAAPAPFSAGVAPSEVYSELTAEQARVLQTLPRAVLHALLRTLDNERRSQPLECRFCKSNGERASFYKSHGVRDGAGRVSCPVLRAFRCRRCGATGDAAHTIKYCPLSTAEERIQSAGMMRSVRMSSGRRRQPAPDTQYVVFGDPTPAVLADSGALDLDPLWAALERKLLM